MTAPNTTQTGQKKGPSDSTIRKRLRELRKFIEDDSNDIVAIRVAYSVEHAIRWARSDTTGWISPMEDAIQTAQFIRGDLGSHDRP